MAATITPIKPLGAARATKAAPLSERSGTFLPDRVANARRRVRTTATRVQLSRQLFIDNCRREQQLSLERGFVLVRGSLGGIYYLARSFVCRIDVDGALAFCIHANVGEADRYEEMLALKLLIETNEGRFIRLANVSRRLNQHERDLLFADVLALARLRGKINDPSVSVVSALIASHRFVTRSTKEKNHD